RLVWSVLVDRARDPVAGRGRCPAGERCAGRLLAWPGGRDADALWRGSGERVTMGDADYDKLLPDGIPPWQMPFWDSLRERSAVVQKCDECGTFVFIPKERCPKCLSSRMTWTPISGRGEVYTYTVVHRAPTPAYQAEAPYVIAHVTMEEGFRMA